MTRVSSLKSHINSSPLRENILVSKTFKKTPIFRILRSSMYSDGDIYSGILNRHQSMNNSYNVKEISPKIVNVEVWGLPQSPTPTEFLNNYSMGTTVNNSSYLKKDGVAPVPNLKQFSTILQRELQQESDFSELQQLPEQELQSILRQLKGEFA